MQRQVQRIQKISREEALRRLPKNISSEISALALGFVIWEIEIDEIQCLGWPWIIVPINRSSETAKFISLWNEAKKNGGGKDRSKSMVIFSAGSRAIIPHPVFWRSESELIGIGEEFGNFLMALPSDALTREGFERLEADFRKKKVEAAEEREIALPAPISKSLESIKAMIREKL